MKSIKLTVLFCLFLALYSCTDKDSEKEKSVSSEVEKQTTEQVEQDGLQAIELIVKEMLTTSPRYKQLTKGLQAKVLKNGGSYYGVYLERSPERNKGKEDNYSKSYDFTIYEMYDARQLNTSRFSFNPVNNQLYEYDILNDSLVPIEFDKTLLLKYDSLNNKQKVII